ncbi:MULTISPECIES: hypothetical protein [unclassified Ensifer]|uniref:hypothetical protein n=1 Tax=unclassified Ensifer TaxID=2633371 RepID=UPI00081363AE|nr:MULTISPECIES: hypothetical protein [unclassified Ensifer]OCP00725.1 hypothetical protein BC362_23705 [Ensifer sp. LC14]OCP04583.1 hypothetical protein BBX50_25185 [Ensifer sp. LC11]OCP09636.1 hypothetical protein BC374_03580 [Ensifer sp. LC13]OCP30682.1 hypothetical protein BC364_24870 [Ensifer sp. LC499]
MNNADGRNLPEGRSARQARPRRRLRGKGILIISATLSILVVLLLGGQPEGAPFAPHLDPSIDPDGFPNLGYHVRSHWIDGQTLYYSKDETLVVRNIDTGSERYIPFGGYEVKSLIAKGSEIALAAKTKETFWDRFSGRIRFAYEQENDIYNGIACRLDTATCEVKVTGNYMIRDFQPYLEGYVFSKTEWEDYSLGADLPMDVRSSVVVVTPDGRFEPGAKFGGIQSLFVSENGSFVDIRNASELTFPAGDNVYRWSGGDVHPIYLVGLQSDRYRDAYSGQLRTDGFHWALSSYNIINGKRSGLSSDYFCANRTGQVDSKTALFLHDRSIMYIDSQGKLVVLDCRSR